LIILLSILIFYLLLFCIISTNEALIIPVGTATTPTPTKDIIVPNILPPSVKGKISLNPTPVKDETAHQKDSVILENC